MDHTAKFYSRPSYVGSGVVFSGARRQRGGSVLGALKSMVVPIIKSVGPKIMNKVGSIAKKQMFGLATDLLSDKIRGRNMTESLKTRGKSRLLQSASQGLNSIGNMMGRPKKRAATKKRAAPKKKRAGRFHGSGVKKRKTAAKQKSSRKRKASRNRATPAKRRRVNF